MKNLYLFLLLIPFAAVAQGVTIGSNNPPDPSAVLDLQSTQQGLLLPRLTSVQRNAIVNPVAGLMIYNTDLNCYEGYFPNSGWKSLECDCNSYPNASFVSPSTSVNVATPFQAPAGGGTYLWTFQSGTPSSSILSNPQVTWSSPGTYGVSLTVTDATGCSSTHIDSVTVSNCPPLPVGQSITFSYTGSVQTWTVPACVTQITIEAWGAEGGMGYQSGLVGPGGKGGYVKGTKAVTPGTVLNIYVGGKGQNGGVGVGGSGGWNGGGLGGSYSTLYGGGGGGGASDVRLGGTGLGDRILVAGGGGGGSYYVQATGGDGGYPKGGDGLASSSGIVNAKSGLGGTQNAGGAGGTDTQAGSLVGSPGVAGVGGNAGVGSCSGGGGGGWYGGGGGSGCNGGGGGGGSSYTGGLTGGISTQNGIRVGDGQVVISW